VGIALLIPRTSFVASFFASGIFAGAMATHVFIIGIVSDNDGGMLFLMATTCFFLSVAQMFMQRRQKSHSSGI
jgi:fucose permease